jgi:hypothetical protein
LLATATMKVAVTITARGVAYRNWLAQELAARSTTAAIARSGAHRMERDWCCDRSARWREGSAQETAPVLG